ncbi:helix-turn-helix domain-containing protein [Teichococcus oryzae]|uniref:Helix-turn-helix domain-containing protein n=1 Tax=Teichococcus oryzae TaxID=1608942 RepID=A0A5B2TID3_9PROT|nr:helix-turn-helix domain-containing protein [Pseudoroseomonas oryzae]KAA2213688.1 helix-turn-helix domain-containing protein [Pseudoroseomonas oryzae]
MQTAMVTRNPAQAFPFPVFAKAGSALVAERFLGRPLRLARGAEIYAEGSPIETLFEVVSGTVRTRRLLPDGRRCIASFALPGEVFGLDGTGRHRFSAEAVTEAVVIAFARKDIEDCIGREPRAAHSWQAFTLRHLEAAQDRCILLGRRSAAERVASFLADLADRGQHGPHLLDLPMSRYDIADYLGLTAETVSRTLSALRRRRLIADGANHQIHILDRDALDEQAGEGDA